MLRLLLAIGLVATFACGDDDATDDPTTPGTDAAVRDGGGSSDGGGPVDGGSDDAGGDIDAGSDDDAGADIDAGPADDMGTTDVDLGTDVDMGSSPCDGQTIGQACRASCPGAYECVDSRCMPGRGRPSCGGFAGAMCTTRAFPECTYLTSGDFGPCLSTEERACACAEHSDIFSCR